jgi:hypothetical protein
VLRTPATLVVGLVLGPACASPGPGECVVSLTRSALVGGTSSAEYLLATAQELSGVLRFQVHGEAREPAFCMGVVVGADTLLTAAHCFAEAEAALLPAGAEDGGPMVPESIVPHDTLDLALVRLPAGATAHLTPLRTPREAMSLNVGDLTQLAGFRHDEHGLMQELTFAVETVVRVSPEAITVSGFGFSGACYGDSGGPLLVRSASGAIEVAGILSRGALSCRGEDSYTRLDVVIPWLNGQGVGTESSAVPVSCGNLDIQGRCYGAVATYCDAGKLVTAECTRTTRACGWDARANGYRCVRPEDDPCHGVSDLGACSQGVGLRCNLGTLLPADCTICGGECVWSPASGETTCYEE